MFHQILELKRISTVAITGMYKLLTQQIHTTPGAASGIPAYPFLLWRFILKLQESYMGKNLTNL